MNPITYSERNGQIRIEMASEEYSTLLLMLGMAYGAIPPEDLESKRKALKFVNEINRTNPRWTPYEVG